MDIKSKLSVLVQLANIDGDFDSEEKNLIYMIGKANGIPEKEIDGYVENPEPLPPLNTMSEDDKFECLFHLVQLMKIDNQIYLSEIKFCEDLAEKIGFKKSVISALSSRIYSDPAIASDVTSLKRAIKKYQH
ncbi:MAG: TerB family tellurite resistance protein [Ekhidna sp.]|nr:TerB family tellurite resistance protein [Ekhidna sp.]MBC6409213.1 TerB family tellurite resistance protein [Ekhidna sp.]MBC6427590.1 TerB family tellurite resistance protein [Ekhidna sp.]